MVFSILQMAGSLTGGSERFAAGLPVGLGILSILTIPPGPAIIPTSPETHQWGD